MPPRMDIYFGDNLGVMKDLPDESFDLIYVDPPFNTGKTQQRKTVETTRDEAGDRVGFQGKRYKTSVLDKMAFEDAFDNFLEFLVPRLEQAHRLLRPDGSFFLHLDYREVHYCRVALDELFGRDCFMNEIIWAYDFGARSKSRWSTKHDNILWYVMDPDNYTFNYEAMDRIPYMAPGLVSEEKAQKGKTPTDVWWHTIVPTNGRERTGYPTQKPLGVIERIVRVHSEQGDELMDFFAGSGTLGEAAIKNGRNATLVDNNPEAMEVMSTRLAFARPTWHGYEPDSPPENESPLFERT